MINHTGQQKTFIQTAQTVILHLSHHLLNVLLQIANKLGLSNKKKTGKTEKEIVPV
jgi:hypothetical protein